MAGPDGTLWRDRVGLFPPGSPLASEAGVEILSGPRDYDKVKRDLAAAGYRGEKIIMLASTVGYIAILSQVGVDQLRKAGMDVDLQLMDFHAAAPPREPGTARQRRVECPLQHYRRHIQLQSGGQHGHPGRWQERHAWLAAQPKA